MGDDEVFVEFFTGVGSCCSCGWSGSVVVAFEQRKQLRNGLTGCKKGDDLVLEEHYRCNCDKD